MKKLKQGIVQVYTGNGKGKTTAALGLSLRAVGQGLRVCFIQFLKSEANIGERKAAKRLAPELEIHFFAAKRWGDREKAAPGTPWWKLPPSDEDRAKAQEGLAFVRRALTSGEYDLIILDEILGALRTELLSLDQVLELIKFRPPDVELVLTGRSAPEAIIEAADLVTEMNPIKHPFERGMKARKGIEF